MISPELLRRYPLFGLLNDGQQKALAMISAERSYQAGEVIHRENSPASRLYVVISGEVDLLYSGGGEGAITFAPVGSIAPGEVFGVSSLLEPFSYFDTAKAARDTQLIEIDTTALRALVEVDHDLGFFLTRQFLQAALERLKYTQIELAAVRV